MAGKRETPLWLKRSPEEIEAIVVKLAKENIPIAKIGIILRDSYGTPSAKISGKKISKILKESDIQVESEIDALVKKSAQLRKHLEKNKQDKVAKKSLITIESRVLKLNRYLQRKGLLPKSKR